PLGAEQGSEGGDREGGGRGRSPDRPYYPRLRLGYCGGGCHHPHVHMIVPGGGISLDGTHWVRCKPGFLLPVRVLSRLFRRLFLAALADAHAANRLAFFGEIEGLRRREAFAAH